MASNLRNLRLTLFTLFTLNISGRLAAVQYKNPTAYSVFCDTTFQEWYSYNAGGARVGKELQVSRGGVPASLASSYTYDTEGRMTSQKYPDSFAYDGVTGNPTVPVTGPTLSYTYDTMGRLSGLTENGTNNIISSTTYGPAGELTSMSGTWNGPWGAETRSYNAMKQLTYLSSGGLSIGYNYSATQNNGKITSQHDYVSGETVMYTYDTLNRLATAQTADPTWGQSYAYDGFGNLTDITTTKGTTPEWHTAYSASTNRAGSDCADANGNILIVGSGCSFLSAYSYDVENRIIFSGVGTVPAVEYAYAPDNKRVWRGVFSSDTRTVDEVTFWSVTGQRVGVYDLVSYGATLRAMTAPYPGTGTEYYFGGRLIKNLNGYTGGDRLGSIGKYYPYGQERPSATANGTEKFATYFRDSDTGLDYADQRYHAPGQGRFLSPDPYQASVGPADPGSWNRYSYVSGDPVNGFDPRGTTTCDANGTNCYDSVDVTEGGSVEPTGGGGGAIPRPNQRTPQEGGTGGGLQLAVLMKQKLCGAIPQGHAYSVNGSLGLLGGGAGSVELVLDYATGDASIVVSGGFGAGNASGAGGSLTNGYIFGSGDATHTAAQDYASGGNTTANLSLPNGLVFSATANSGGITGNPATLSASSATAFSIGFGGGLLNWTFPIPSAQATNNISTYDLGNFISGPLSGFFPTADQLLASLKQACN